MTPPVVSRRWLGWGDQDHASAAHQRAPKGQSSRDAQDAKSTHHAKDTKAIILRVLHHAHAMGQAGDNQ
jgi:hypothetical protein